MRRLLDSHVLRSCGPVFEAFDETLMFEAARGQASTQAALKSQFKHVFRNISMVRARRDELDEGTSERPPACANTTQSGRHAERERETHTRARAGFVGRDALEWLVRFDRVHPCLR